MPRPSWLLMLAEAARVVATGASEVRRVDRHHVVMADPGGNEFCVA